MTKQIQPQDKMVQSLLNLRDELIANGHSEYAFKLNSCLFSEYPHANHSAAWREKYRPESWVGNKADK